MRTTMCFLRMAFWFPILVYLGWVRWETAPNKLWDEGNKPVLFCQNRNSSKLCFARLFGMVALQPHGNSIPPWCMRVGFLYARTPMKAGRAPCCSLAIKQKDQKVSLWKEVGWSCWCLLLFGDVWWVAARIFRDNSTCAGKGPQYLHRFHLVFMFFFPILPK